MFQIKICGVTNVDDARAAADAGADAIGLNFFNESRRFVTPEIARQIAAALPATVTKVGVFVNHSAKEIAHTVDQVGLDCIQLHGDEPPIFLTQIPQYLGIVSAFRCGQEPFATLPSYLYECRSLGRLPDAVLIDADAGTEFGGTGRLADWLIVAKFRTGFKELPLLLAGGLTPDNVGDAVVAVRPDGVDVASGVERQPGTKDRVLMKKFIAAAREAFDRM